MSSSTFNSQHIPHGREEAGPPFVSDSVTSSYTSQGSSSPTPEELHASTWNQVFGNRPNQGSSGPETPYAPAEVPVQQYSQALMRHVEARGTLYPQEGRFENHSMSQPAHQPAQDHTNYRPPSATHQYYGNTPTSAPPSAREFPYPPVPLQLPPQHRDYQRDMSRYHPPTTNSSGRPDSRHPRGQKPRHDEAGSNREAWHYGTSSSGDCRAYAEPSREMHVIYE